MKAMKVIINWMGGRMEASDTMKSYCERSAAFKAWANEAKEKGYTMKQMIESIKIEPVEKPQTYFEMYPFFRVERELKISMINMITDIGQDYNIERGF
jgi:hypothetical protein